MRRFSSFTQHRRVLYTPASVAAILLVGSVSSGTGPCDRNDFRDRLETVPDTGQSLDPARGLNPGTLSGDAGLSPTSLFRGA